MVKQRLRTLLIWMACFVVVILLYNAFQRPDLPQRGWKVFADQLDAGEVAAVRFDSDDASLIVTPHGGRPYRTYGVPDADAMAKLEEQGVDLAFGEPASGVGTTLLITWAPILLIVGLFLYFLKRNAGAAGTNIFSLRKANVRTLPAEARVTFADVGGCVEAKQQLADVVDFLKNPKTWVEAGARVPRGILLEGPPGCGKTLLARAVAGETSAHFYVIAASEFVEMFVGVGAARVRDLFESASKTAPAVIFIDEIDAVGRRRGSGLGSAHDEREQTLNQLLVCLDGFELASRIVVLGATNRPDILDPALTRAGRFDRRLRVPLLDRDARRQALAIHTRGKPLAPDVDLDAVAEQSEGLSGADLETLANDAALLAARRARYDGAPPSVAAADLAAALDGRQRAGGVFDKLDLLLVESRSQLAEPTGRVHVRLTLRDGQELTGDVVWADAMFLKIRDAERGERVVPKAEIRLLEAQAGTAAAAVGEVVADRWAGRQVDLA
jgi:cell division protease FtsH